MLAIILTMLQAALAWLLLKRLFSEMTVFLSLLMFDLNTETVL